MRYLLDTNILLAYLRRNEATKTHIDQMYNPFDATNYPIISAVSLGELESIVLQNDWGETRKKQLFNLVNQLIVIDIYAEDIIQKYAEIDAFSQGRLKSTPLNTSARNMSKNDSWIAATASTINAQLLTTDQDFRHLHNQFLQLIEIPIMG
jgi:tRNA(fMet)-specific endonuclease VapC